MQKFYKIFFIFLVLNLISCSTNIKEENIIKEKSIELQVLEIYQEGMKALENGDALFAAKKFNEAEILFPQSLSAPKSALMAAYAYYSQDYYGDSIAELERFIKVYPLYDDIDYAHYLLAICFYEQIVDEKKDLRSIQKSKEKFEFILQEFPNSLYAVDSEFKLDLIYDLLASKEMYIGRYYFEKKKWIPAINRFRYVLDEFETTMYIEEALYRLVEIHYHIGLKEEAKKYAKLLGYNYQSSEWYEKSYSIFNETHEKNKKTKNKNMIDKIKSLFE